MKQKNTTMFIITLICAFTTIGYGTTARYRLSWRDNPATSMVIGWDQVNGTNPVVEYSKKTLTPKNKRIKIHTPDNTVNYMGMNNTFARLHDLKPDTLYFFRIKDSNSSSPVMSFRTAPSNNKSFSFIAGGDSRGNREVRKRGNILVAKLRPLFVIFGGDYSTTLKPQLCKAWLDDWQLTRSQDGRMYPVIPTHGNHENGDITAIIKLFDVPKTYYAITFGKKLMRVYTLNTEFQWRDKQRWPIQNKWFAQDLAEHKNIIWKVVAYHRPMRPHTIKKKEMDNEVKAWGELFYKYGVNLAIESDSHTVKRTYPVRAYNGPGSFEGFIRDDAHGTTFIGEGSWGAPLRPANDAKPWTMAMGSFYQFKLIHVSKKHLEIRSVKFDNADKVTPLQEKNRMDIPANLHIWTPESGPILKINAR